MSPFTGALVSRISCNSIRWSFRWRMRYGTELWLNSRHIKCSLYSKWWVSSRLLQPRSSYFQNIQNLARFTDRYAFAFILSSDKYPFDWYPSVLGVFLEVAPSSTSIPAAALALGLLISPIRSPTSILLWSHWLQFTNYGMGIRLFRVLRGKVWDSLTPYSLIKDNFFGKVITIISMSTSLVNESLFLFSTV